jgi:electron transport complex protein RnfD
MIFVIIGGLFLLYRGVIDYRIPLLIVLFMFLSLLIMPIPVTLTDIGPRWTWLAMRDPSVGHAVAITFANYQLAASPAMFMALFLATSPIVRPITRRGRTIFAVAIGILTAGIQLYASVSWGPYAALMLVGLITPIADRFFQPRPLA